MTICEQMETPIRYECDVLVCGGGIAGIAAALAATRCGKKVILTEKQYILGGLATAGLVTIYLPLCDGKGHQVSYGIAEELFRLSISMGAEDSYPENWLNCDDMRFRTEKDKRFLVQYNAQLFAMLAEQLLIKENVEILYGSYAVAVDKTEDRINAVVIENKSGRQGIRAKSIVDATGDGDLVWFAGLPTEKYDIGNSLAAWYYSCGTQGYRLNMLGVCDVPDERQAETSKVQLHTGKTFSGLDGQELSECMQLSHSSILNDIKRQRKEGKDVFPVTVATIPQIRMSRKLVGEYVMNETDIYKHVNDSIGMVSDWRKRGPIYEVPFRCLYNKQIKNLIVAGRNVSVDTPMWDIMRVIPCCAVTGQAAGTAAAMTDDFRKINVCELQRILTENKVVLHIHDLLGEN